MYPEVKEIDGGWEVKLGAGILPVKITQQDIDFFDIMSGSTITPNRSVEEVIKMANCVAAVKKYLYNAR